MAMPSFVSYNKDQLCLLPLDLNVMIEEDDLVRVVDSVIDSIDTSSLIALYPGGGRSSYHPVMLLKVIVYAYTSGIYSSRKIEQATRENIRFLWLSAMTTIDHSTIARFRSGRLKDVFEVIFSDIVELIAKQGYLSLQTYFLDGTKVEANANKYSYSWKKNTERYQKELRQRVHEHLEYIDKLNEQEDELYSDIDPEKIDSDKIQEVADKINEKLRTKQKDQLDKELKQAKKKLVEEQKKMKRYEAQMEIYEGRNSFSKTDHDATFMRMKDAGNNQKASLKAAYNVQIATDKQFVIDYSIHRRPGDTGCFIPHLKHHQELFGTLPLDVIADAGYGSEENYEFLEEENINGFVKYNTFYKEMTGKIKKDTFDAKNWNYDKENDTYTCPGGELLPFKEIVHPVSALGYEATAKSYECKSCKGCSLRDNCIKSQTTPDKRTVLRNERQMELREKAKELLTSEKGIAFRKRRSVDVEPVFGDIKQNHGFTRFLLRGLEKVSVEWGLICLGHNMRKLARAKEEDLRTKKETNPKTKASRMLATTGFGC